MGKLKSKISPTKHIKHVQNNDNNTPGIAKVIHNYNHINKEHVNDPASLILVAQNSVFCINSSIYSVSNIAVCGVAVIA